MLNLNYFINVLLKLRSMLQFLKFCLYAIPTHFKASWIFRSRIPSLVCGAFQTSTGENIQLAQVTTLLSTD